ncbi:MAG: IS630 family transposase, partial [Bryobacteraceae bacterium]
HYLDQRNGNPKPFVWTADADLILGKVQRLCERISNSGH